MSRHPSPNSGVFSAPAYEKESQTALIGMELEVGHQYGLNAFAE